MSNILNTMCHTYSNKLQVLHLHHTQKCMQMIHLNKYLLRLAAISVLKLMNYNSIVVACSNSLEDPDYSFTLEWK